MRTQEVPPVLSDISDNVRTNYVAFASFVILVWDHMDTFADEVEYIWKGNKSLFQYLFLFNRYFTPLGFIINLYAYLSPIWTFERCSHFVRYEGFTFAIAIEVVGVMMLLRINAIYPHHKWLSRGLAFYLLLETVMIVWLISGGQAVIHNSNSGVHACTMICDPSVVASALAWMPLLYDTMVFGLTLYRTVPLIRRDETTFIVKRLLEDGILYYSVIFSVTMVLTLMIVTAPPGTRYIAAQTEQLITVAMMSRITIHLKKAANHSVNDATTLSHSVIFNHETPHRQSISLQLFDDPFSTSRPKISQLSADTTPPPLTGPSSTDDMAGPASFRGHHDLIHKPPSLISPSKTSYIEVV